MTWQSAYLVAMTGFGVTFADGTSSKLEGLSVPVFFDSGNTLSHLPTPIYQVFTNFFPQGHYDPKSDLFIVPSLTRLITSSRERVKIASRSSTRSCSLAGARTKSTRALCWI